MQASTVWPYFPNIWTPLKHFPSYTATPLTDFLSPKQWEKVLS
jgi:hypothetical protein